MATKALSHFQKAVTFGQQLLETGDLDPMYIILHRADLSRNRLCRFVVAYSCLYHMGAAAYITQFAGKDFWRVLEEAARNNTAPVPGMRWPRGAERRHWRGKAAMDSVVYFRSKFETPEDVTDFWYGQTNYGTGPRVRTNFEDVSQRVMQTSGFGPWIAFKLADIGDRVLGYSVDFNDCELGVYRDPRKGAALLFAGDMDYKIGTHELKLVLERLQRTQLGAYDAPPTNDRRINVQELETILCKYKSHVNGHYPMGKDTKEIAHVLTLDDWGPVAKKLRAEAVRLLKEQQG